MNCRRNSASSGDGEIINLSSMIDVMFILIIFFLVTTTFKEEEIDHMVNLPTDARNQSLTQSTDTLVKINIRKSGAYVIQGKQVTEEEIDTYMETELQKKPELKVLIRCDQDAKHLYLANIMSICRHVGVPRANIAVKTEQ
jgi:biopolymer transport protein ExbD